MAKFDASRGTAPQWQVILRHAWPLWMLLALLVAFYAFGLHKVVTLDTLRANRDMLVGWVDGRLFTAGAIFFLIYVIAVATSVPGGAFLTLVGGFLFGALPAMTLVVFGATAGATILFLIARSTLGEPLKAKAGPWLDKVAAGFGANAFSYLLSLRLIPAFPFFVVNLVPAFLGVSLRDFVVTTFIGIIPGTFVFATFGAGLGIILDGDENVGVWDILTTDIIVALSVLAILALLPVAYKRWKAGKR